MAQLLFNSHVRLDQKLTSIMRRPITSPQPSDKSTVQYSNVIDRWPANHFHWFETFLSHYKFSFTFSVGVVFCFERCWNFDDTIRNKQWRANDRNDGREWIDVEIGITIHDVCLCTHRHTIMHDHRNVDYVWPILSVPDRVCVNEIISFQLQCEKKSSKKYQRYTHTGRAAWSVAHSLANFVWIIDICGKVHWKVSFSIADCY